MAMPHVQQAVDFVRGPAVPERDAPRPVAAPRACACALLVVCECVEQADEMIFAVDATAVAQMRVEVQTLRLIYPRVCTIEHGVLVHQTRGGDFARPDLVAGQDREPSFGIGDVIARICDAATDRP